MSARKLTLGDLLREVGRCMSADDPGSELARSAGAVVRHVKRASREGGQVASLADVLEAEEAESVARATGTVEASGEPVEG